jgi:molecular chaperone IbpA
LRDALETGFRFSNSFFAVSAAPGAVRARLFIWALTGCLVLRKSCIGSALLRIHLALQEDLAMRTYDFSPLWRSTIGFDRVFDLLDETQRAVEDHYPPYNIERLGDDRYQISLALAGFAPDELAITAEQNVLTVEGRKADQENREYLYQGISSRPFKRQFNLADHVQVTNASFDNGLLRIELVREIPEAMKPRRIAIGTAPVEQIAQQKAA